MKTLWGVLSCTLVLSVSSVAVVAAHTNLKPGFNLFSTQQDVQIGQQSAVAIERQLPMLNEPASSDLVQRIGARLAANAPGAHFPYRFKVVNLSDLNAFALPGGYIYVHRGLIENTRTEGELAGVLAHEISHVALRHPTSQMTKAYGAQTGASLLGALLGGSHASTGGKVAQAAASLGLNAMFLRYSRTAESEADAMGAQIMARSGYNPNEMANFFQFMRQKAGSDPGKVAQFFSSHPSPSDRESHVRSEARGYTVRRATPVGGLQMAKNELRRLAPAPKMSEVTPRTSLVPQRGAPDESRTLTIRLGGR